MIAYDWHMQHPHLTATRRHCQCDSVWLADAPRLGAACLQAILGAILQLVLYQDVVRNRVARGAISSGVVT